VSRPNHADLIVGELFALHTNILKVFRSR
jgi:hypothetical protein